MRSAEYDAFGPWILPVDSADLVPRLFRAHPLDLQSALMVLKVPRNITRRDASPEMDLYDHLVVVEEHRLQLLSRAPRAYDVTTVEHSQVTAIDYGADLLDGWLTLHMIGAPPLALRYNAASEAIVERLVALLRRLALDAPADAKTLGAGPGRAATGPAPTPALPITPALPLMALGELDVDLVTTQHAVARAEPTLRVLASHARRRIAPARGEVVARVADLFVPTTLHGAIVLAGEGELHVLRRRSWLVRSRRPENSIGRTVLFLSRCGGASVREDDRFVGARVLSVPVGEATIELVVPAGSSAERALAGTLGVPLPVEAA